MKLVVLLHPNRPSAQELGAVLVAEAVERGFHAMASPHDAERLPGSVPYDPEDGTAADVIVAVGGDGTMLAAARLGRLRSVPILGVNAGTVGFLAEVEPTRISAALDRLASGAYDVSERMTLRGNLPDGTEIDALNDVVIEKAASQHIVGISVLVAGETLAEYRADALIVASPTGSTAYTFSAGGPLVDPEVEALILTAVAPHNLFGRAIVFGPDVELEIGITGERSAGVNADGRVVGALEPGESVRVRRGPHRDRLIRLEPSNFARTVKDKFRIHDA